MTAALADHLSWRHTYLVLAAILAVVTIPAHALALRAPWPDTPTNPARTTEGAAGVGRSRPFLLLAAAFTLSSFTRYAVVVALVPLLLERGYTTSQAAWALGIGGAGQTLGRTLYAALARRTTATVRTTTRIALGALVLQYRQRTRETAAHALPRRPAVRHVRDPAVLPIPGRAKPALPRMLDPATATPRPRGPACRPADPPCPTGPPPVRPRSATGPTPHLPLPRPARRRRTPP